MKNDDLIAFLKPIRTQFSGSDAIEFLDATGRVTDIRATKSKLTIRLTLSAGLYSGRFETTPNSFDMSTAMIDMVRVPDGKRVPIGPWDLDHLRNVMAMPTARTYVNGKLKGGLWCAMPGPEQIAQGRLAADFGFEAEDGDNELVLEWIERDLERMDWSRLDFLELRTDDRRPFPLMPITSGHPRVFLSAVQAKQVHARWRGKNEYETLLRRMRTEDLVFLTDNSQGTLELASLIYALSGDETIGARVKATIMELAHAPTWSGRPDPLLMGGDNDRIIGMKLYQTALAWEYLQPIFTEDDRRAILAKAVEYLQKIYDFTVLQRSYMGYPSIEPHSLGAWNGAAIACMAFYDDLEIARHALPFFHGLFVASLKLFPASGKAAWATYFPFHMVLYLAAAQTFGGNIPELRTSAFLDHLGEALLASFPVPNSQEMQRGLRTREHRFLVAYLCRFHPTPGIELIYRAFAEKEKSAAGDVMLGIFDVLYAPALAGDTAAFPDRPLIARDVGEIIAASVGEHRVGMSLSAGAKAGRQAVFSLMPQNREFAPSMAAFEVTVDGTPVLCNINMSQYGLNSALTNTMCFEDGGALTNGQYLNGAVAPECNAMLRRCLADQRYIYAHVVITQSLDPRLKVKRAERIFIFDRKSGVILLSDSFAGEQAIRFATHLHCSGSVTQVADSKYKLTGGQANLIAGIKGGSKGLSEEEKGEIFVHLLASSMPTRVIVEEPTWVPGYIYGLNNTGLEEISDGRFPRYRRWRLEAAEPVADAAFLLALSPQSDQVRYVDGAVGLPESGGVRMGYGTLEALGIQCEAECLLWDEATQRVTAMGVRSLRHGICRLAFDAPVDFEYSVNQGQGTVYSHGAFVPRECSGFDFGAWRAVGEDGWRTIAGHRAAFQKLNLERKEIGGNA